MSAPTGETLLVLSKYNFKNQVKLCLCSGMCHECQRNPCKAIAAIIKTKHMHSVPQLVWELSEVKHQQHAAAFLTAKKHRTFMDPGCQFLRCLASVLPLALHWKKQK